RINNSAQLALLASLGVQAKPQLLVTSPVSYATAGVGGTAWLGHASAYYPAYASYGYPAYAAYTYAPVYGAYATYPYYPYLRR
ncbi:hypothetical protein KR200_001710, partial [Drosophila serrata]